MLSAAQRVTSAADYRRVVRRGRRVHGAVATAHVLVEESGGEPRFGFIVSKAVGNAVTRNRVRRRMKAASAAMAQRADAGSLVVFRAKPVAATAPYSDIAADVDRAIERTRQR